MIPHISKRRLLLINLITLAVFPVVIWQIVRLTIQNHDTLVRFAERQHNIVIEIEPERGAILDRNGRELAANLKVPSIYAVPRLISSKHRTKLVEALHPILGLERSFLKERLSRNKAFVWLKRRTSVAEADAVLKLNNPNLGITYEPKRFYPHGEMLSNVVGFCNVDTVGVEGLELLYQSKLQGRSGYRYTKRDALGRELPALERKLIPAVDGADIVLTIDQYIQYLTEQALDQACQTHRAKSAVAIVMNPKTGEILAMASRPTFDPNLLSASDIASRRNRTITDIFEPGSEFKIITAAGALNEGKVSLQDVIDCENGEWRARPKRVIHDVHPYGRLTFPEVLIKSSNIGTVKIAQKLGEKSLYHYIKQFGFGEKTGIDFPGEVSGILRPTSQWSKISITSIPFGQEVAATAIQMVRAISAIANGGRLVKPYLLKEIRDAKGITLVKQEPVISEPILKPETAVAMNRILERVVTEGTGDRAKMEGIRAAGKTGTSQKLDPNGGYSHNHFVGSFIGYAPAEDPMLAMIVSIDDPHPYYYGGTVAAPVFREVMERSLYYLGYVPEKESEKSVSAKGLSESVGAGPELRENLRSELPGAPPQVPSVQ